MRFSVKLMESDDFCETDERCETDGKIVGMIGLKLSLKRYITRKIGFNMVYFHYDAGERRR